MNFLVAERFVFLRFCTAILLCSLFFTSCQKKGKRPVQVDVGNGHSPGEAVSTGKVEPPPELGDTFMVGASGTEMIQVNPGVFQMGSPDNEPGRDPEETLHKVALTRSFWLGKYEVTRLGWEKVMNPVEPPEEEETDEEEGDEEDEEAEEKDPYAGLEKPRHPKVNVNWMEAMDFCAKLTDAEKTAGRLPAGYVYLLPTEAQWEYSCRAGTTTPTAFGEALGPGDAAIDPRRPYGSAAKARIPKQLNKVGGYKPNAWGFHDMHGNASEWCLDFFYARYPMKAVQDPVHNENTGLKVNRGGSFFLEGGSARSAKRGSDSPHRKSGEVGFRVALVPE